MDAIILNKMGLGANPNTSESWRRAGGELVFSFREKFGLICLRSELVQTVRIKYAHINMATEYIYI